MVRKFLAVVAGLVVALLLVMLIQKFGHSLFPPPADMDTGDQEFMRKYVASLPWGPLAFVIASYVLSAFCGGLVAAMLAGEWPLIFSGIIALAVLAGAVSTMVMIPHPTWFAIAAVGGIVLAAFMAAGVAANRRVNSRAV